MITTQKKFRREYAPLTVAATLRCDTPGSPMAQVYDAICTDGVQYTPDRGLTPTVLMPEVVASASDGSWPSGNCNDRLANVKWWANGTEISQDPAWAGKYSISTAQDETRGMLTIIRNIAVGETVDLYMTAVLPDTRTGVNIPVRSDSITLYTTAKGDDAYSIDFPDGDLILYDELNDLLSIDDYAKANGESGLTASQRNDVVASKRSYRRDFGVTLRRGHNVIAADSVTLRLYEVDADGALTELTPGRSLAYSLPSAADAKIALDLRLVERGTYMLKAFAGEREVARRQFCIDRVKESLDMTMINGGSLSESDTMRTNMAIVTDTRKRTVKYPERLLSMKWYSNSASKGEVLHDSGQIGTVILADAMDASDSSLEISCKAEYAGAYSPIPAADGSYQKNDDGTYKVTR